METNKEQSRVNTYFQDVTIKNACELLDEGIKYEYDCIIDYN